jgi:hypothetical protein
MALAVAAATVDWSRAKAVKMNCKALPLAQQLE